MSRIAHTNAILGELGTKMGLGSLTLDADHKASLTFDERLVTFTYSEDPMELLWIHLDLGPVPGVGPAAPNRILEINLQTWLSNTMTLGLDEAGERVIGFNVLPVASLGTHALEHLLEAMLETTEVVARELHGLEHAPVSGAAAERDAGIHPHRDGFIRI